MNNRKWTDDSYQPHQKINCTITINIMSVPKQDAYTADFIVQSERPIFNSTYSSPILRHADKGIPFEYQENQPLDYSDQNFFGNLTSILAFYANFIIAHDNESFGPKGGQTQLDKCLFIANNVPANLSIAGSPASGWMASEAMDIKGQRSRIGFLLELLKSGSEKFRQDVYNYHLNGLDLIEQDPKKATDNIEAAIFSMASNDNGHYMYKQFVGAKAEEIMNVFKTESSPRRTKIRETLLKIEPVIADRISNK